MEAELKKLFQEMSEHRGELNKLKETLPRSESVSVLALEQKFDAFASKVVAYMGRMDARMDELESYSRRNCLLVHGVPETQDELCSEVVRNLFRSKNVATVELRDIDRAHRLGQRKESNAKPRPIIVKFIGYGPRSIVFRNKAKMKGSGITITESLTKQRQEVLMAARDAHGIANAWSSDGRVVVLSGGEKHKVTTLEALKLIPVPQTQNTLSSSRPLPSPNKVVTRQRGKKKDDNTTQTKQDRKPSVNIGDNKEEEKSEDRGQVSTDAGPDSGSC